MVKYWKIFDCKVFFFLEIYRVNTIAVQKPVIFLKVKTDCNKIYMKLKGTN